LKGGMLLGLVLATTARWVVIGIVLIAMMF
jgi:hypothetical protein